jgi:hypothetical protein
MESEPEAEGFAEDEESLSSMDMPAAPPPPPMRAPGGAPPPPSRPAQKWNEDKSSKRDEAATPAKKKEGLLDFARRLLSPKSPEPKPEPEAKDQGVRTSTASAPSRRVRGKVRRQGKRLIIEIDVTAPMQWSPGAHASVELSDGTMAKVLVDTLVTTAPGQFGLGLTVTLVLVYEESFGEPATIHLANGAEVLEIVL